MSYFWFQLMIALGLLTFIMWFIYCRRSWKSVGIVIISSYLDLMPSSLARICLRPWAITSASSILSSIIDWNFGCLSLSSIHSNIAYRARPMRCSHDECDARFSLASACPINFEVWSLFNVKAKSGMEDDTCEVMK